MIGESVSYGPYGLTMLQFRRLVRVKIRHADSIKARFADPKQLNRLRFHRYLRVRGRYVEDGA